MTELKSDPFERPMVNTTAETREPTFGEKAVGLTFNPSGNPDVTLAKTWCAAVIDQMHDLRDCIGVDPEAARLASIAITEMQGAQMWAVKALTWRTPQPPAPKLPDPPAPATWAEAEPGPWEVNSAADDGSFRRQRALELAVGVGQAQAFSPPEIIDLARAFAVFMTGKPEQTLNHHRV